MSTRTATRLAAPFAVLVFLLDLGVNGTLAEAPFGVQIAVLAVAQLACSVIAIGGAFRRRPATWAADPGEQRFLVSLSPWKAWIAIYAAWAAGQAVAVQRFPPEDRSGFHLFAVLSAACIVVAAAGLILAVVLPLADRPRISLNPDGLTVSRIGRTLQIRWDELAPGGPPRPVGRNPNSLKLYRFGTPPAVLPGRWVSLPARAVHIDTAFLAYTVRCYVAQPDRRVRIGDPRELAQLQHDFTLDSLAVVMEPA